jgi:hypothetical protein
MVSRMKQDGWKQGFFMGWVVLGVKNVRLLLLSQVKGVPPAVPADLQILHISCQSQAFG